MRIPQRGPNLRAGRSSAHTAAQRPAPRKDTARNPWNVHPCYPAAPRGCRPRCRDVASPRKPSRPPPSAPQSAALLIIHEPWDPTRPGVGGPLRFRPVAGGPRCRIRSPTGREGRGPLGRGGRPWVVLGRPRVASAGTTCSEGRGRLGGAAWEVEARAPSKPRG